MISREQYRLLGPISEQASVRPQPGCDSDPGKPDLAAHPQRPLTQITQAGKGLFGVATLGGTNKEIQMAVKPIFRVLTRSLGLDGRHN